MSGAAPGHSGHKARFYLLILTLMVGSIFTLVMYQKDPTKFSLTGSSIELINKKNVTNSSEQAELLLEPEALKQEDQNFIPPSREVEVGVKFTSIPETSKEVKLQELEVHFDNSDGRVYIQLGNDRLEVQKETEVVVKLQDFSGFINFDSEDFSLEGTAGRIEANGLALSSREDLDLSLGNVRYNYLLVDEAEVQGLRLPRGDGELQVAEKLDYRLEQEELNFYVFQGKLLVDTQQELPLTLEGIARGIDVSGALLNIDVR